MAFMGLLASQKLLAPGPGSGEHEKEALKRLREWRPIITFSRAVIRLENEPDPLEGPGRCLCATTPENGLKGPVMYRAVEDDAPGIRNRRLPAI